MKEGNVVNVVFHRHTRAADEMIAQVVETIEEFLADNVDEQTRQQMTQALIHLHEAQLNLS